jgi:hypothetical protein
VLSSTAGALDTEEEEVKQTFLIEGQTEWVILGLSAHLSSASNFICNYECCRHDEARSSFCVNVASCSVEADGQDMRHEMPPHSGSTLFAETI